MEGRTIARPNGGRGMQQHPPALVLQWRAGQLPGQTSMLVSMSTKVLACFNGGPDNCPAKRHLARPFWRSCNVLQWRAGQLPGQTGDAIVSDLYIGDASMEGRTIARPNCRYPCP